MSFLDSLRVGAVTLVGGSTVSGAACTGATGVADVVLAVLRLTTGDFFGAVFFLVMFFFIACNTFPPEQMFLSGYGVSSLRFSMLASPF